VLILLTNVAYAQQQTVSGYVRDSLNKALPSATVNLVNDKGTILAFAFTNDKGAFNLSFTVEEVVFPLWLQASYIGYRNQRIAVSAGQSVYRFNLSAQPDLLKEVVINNKPSIERLGDTLRYEVGKFAQKEDRSIGDVLKRMPGIEVADDGAIYFNGEKISNLYIQGDDLMSGRYGAATRSIRKEMIASVDIMKNHQPIKILKNKISSDNVALNLVLKDEKSLKLAVNGMIGGGWPGLYDASATAILLNKRFKALNTIGLNNSGVNYTDDFKQLGTSNFTSNINSAPPRIDVSMGTIGPPDLPLPNYYFNNSRIINLNDLYKTSKDVQFKLNLQAFVDRSSLSYFSQTDNYLPNDTISFMELQSYTNKPSRLNTSLNVMINKEKYFLNNDLRFELSNEENTSSMNFNAYNFNQRVNKKIKSFSNEIHWMPALSGKGIGEVRWLISYNRNAQSLDIGKGYHFQIPDQQGYYDDVVQSVRLPALFSNLYFGFKLAGNIVTQSYTAGLIVESQDLNSQLALHKNGGTTPYLSDAGNNLHWYRSDPYISLQYQIRYKRLVSTIQLPVSYQNIRYSQQEYGLDAKHDKLLFNPSVNVKYDFTPEQHLTTSYSFNNNFSDISGVYRGGILHNYRSFTANDAGLQQRSTHSLAANYDFENAVNMLFVNTGISFDKTVADAILSTAFLNNVQKTVFLPHRNTQRRLSLKAGFSKYLFALKTTASLKSSWNRFRNMGIVNGTLQPFHTKALLFSGKIMKKMFSTVTFTYEPKGMWSTSWSDYSDNEKSKSKNHTFRLDQNMTLGLMPMKQMNVSATARYSFSNRSNSNGVKYFFMDAKATYTKKRMDLSFSVNNLFNVTNYTLYSLTPYQQMIDEYNIRGRMGMLRAHYYF
jgi:hypothetical protein